MPVSVSREEAAVSRCKAPVAHHRFHHTGGPLIPDLDCLVWDFILHSGRKADRIILVEL